MPNNPPIITHDIAAALNHCVEMAAEDTHEWSHSADAEEMQSIEDRRDSIATANAFLAEWHAYAYTTCSICDKTFAWMLAGMRRHPRSSAGRFCSADCREEAHRRVSVVSWHKNKHRWRPAKAAAQEAEAQRRQRANAASIADGGWVRYPEEY